MLRVRFVSRKNNELTIGYEIGCKTVEGVGVLHIGLLKREGVWKMERFATDI